MRKIYPRIDGNMLSSNCCEVIIRGTVDHIVRTHEAMAYKAAREENRDAMHLHFQHADHYKRIAKGEK